MLKKLRFAVGALCVTAASLFAAPPLKAEKLKLGNEGIYPPFSIVASDGSLTGIEPDWAREMCKRMNAECEFVVMDFKALIPSLLQGKFDALTSQINPTPERKDKALFTIPIVYNPSTFVVPADANYTFTAQGLKNVRIGGQRGSADMAYMIRMVGKDVPVSYYDNPDQTRLDLLAHRIDAAFGAKINWTLELINKPEGKDWKLAGGDHWVGDPSVPEAERGLSWIARKDKAGEALVKRMDVALESMIKDCTFTKIRQKYLQISVLKAEDPCIGKTS